MDLTGKHILYLVTEDWYFWSHRLPFARAARDAGARVSVATRLAEHRDRIEAEGFSTHAIPFDRSGLNPLRDVTTISAISNLYRRERPDLVHHVALKPALYGSIAAGRVRRGGNGDTGPCVVNAMAGMGFLFISQRLSAKILRPVIRLAFRFLNNRPATRLIVQNDDDRALFETMGVKARRIEVIRGSGVDIDHFRPAPEKPDPPVAVCVSRMLWDKGIAELVQAARLLKQRGVPVTVRLVGPTDANPASIPQVTLNDWAAEGAIDICGPRDDIAAINAASHIAVLPSYREGLPKSLLEAAASGLPIVATDVEGCREICRDGETGIRVPVRTVEPLADALERLARDPDLRRSLGAGARRAAETEFADTIVVSQTLALYDELLRETLEG